MADPAAYRRRLTLSGVALVLGFVLAVVMLDRVVFFAAGNGAAEADTHAAKLMRWVVPVLLGVVRPSPESQGLAAN